MKLNLGFVIDKPLDEVVITFINQEETPNWKPNVSNVKLVEGIRNTEGAKYKLFYPKKEIKQIISSIELPHKITYTYPELKRSCTHKFRGHDDHTHYNVTIHYQVPWYKQLYYILIKTKLQEQITKDLTRFKDYVENK